MNPHAGKRVLNGAPSQLTRLLPPPDAAGARVDGRTLEELRAFAVRMGGLLRFYGLDDRPDGDWSAFFLSDGSMVEASLRGAAAPGVEQAYAQLARRVAEAPDAQAKQALLPALFAVPHALARHADGWLRALRTIPPSAAARRAERRLAAAIAQELGPALRRLRAWEEGALAAGALPAPTGLDYSVLAPEWGVQDARPDASIFRGAAPADRVDAAVPHLVRAFGGLAEGLAGVGGAAEGLAAAPDGTQKPQVALFEAFARLFGTAQATLDGLAPRYADFYYRQVLRERERGPVPDSVYLAFAVEKDAASPAPVPRGTLFPAGTDAEGRALMYAADTPLTVTPAALSRVRMLRAVRGPLLAGPGAPAPGDEPPVVQVLASRLAGKGDAEAVGAELAAGDGWPTFGAGEAGTAGTLVTAPAELGFAVASPELLLTGGVRTVTLTAWFVYGPVLKERLDAVSAAAGEKPWDAVGAAAGEKQWDPLGLVLEAAFALSVSTTDGWLALETYTATAHSRTGDESARFELVFTLPASVAPLVPLYAGADPPPEGADAEVNPAPDLPTLRAYLRPGAVPVKGARGTVSVYPLPILDAMAVGAVEVKAEVSGLQDVVVANTEGEVDASVPFPVFGGTPAPGTFMELRSPELFSKVPEELTVTVDWAGLPANTDGFSGWYRDYTIGLDGKPRDRLFDNASFAGVWRVVNPGGWTLSTGKPKNKVPFEPVALFRSLDTEAAVCVLPGADPDAALCPRTRFGPLGVAPAEEGPPPYYDPRDSALRLELAAPSYAFGNDLYPINVLNAVVQDLPDAGGCQARATAACQPLLDAAVALGLCAKACQVPPPTDPPTDPATGLPTAPLMGPSTDPSTGPPADPPACVSCVTAVHDGLLAAAVVALLGSLKDEGNRARVRQAAARPVAERPEALREIVSDVFSRRDGGTGGAADGGDGWRRPDLAEGKPCPAAHACVRMLEGTVLVRTCLNADGGPTARRIAGCAAALQASYDAAMVAYVEECMRTRGELRYPNPPYLPQAQVTVDYSAKSRIVPGAGGGGALFHLLPFGGWLPFAAGGEADPPLLPRVAEAGSLLLGFSGMEEAQTLTLLFQMNVRAGDAGPVEPPEVEWAWLDGGRWRTLAAGAIPEDGTHGLRNSGILALQLPRGGAGGTRIPGPERWLRASVADARGFPWTASLRPHALAASWVDPGGGAGAHLALPLPVGTITSSVEALPGIGTIVQPMPSSGGRPPETGATFGVRLGERLRHKDRAVQPWDYERLVLERFPQVWMAQALTAGGPGAAPGSVTVVVVAGAEGNESVDTTAPRAPSALLGRVEDFLAARATPFARVQVINPVYVRVQVEAEVAFRTGPEGGDADRLNGDLIAWLSPWFYDARRAALQGRYASEADVGEFIRTRPYVDGVLSLRLNYDPAPEALEWYFLTSAAAHLVNLPVPAEPGGPAGTRVEGRRPGAATSSPERT
jgi:hypothetical protein